MVYKYNTQKDQVSELRLRLALSNCHKRVGVSLPSPGDGNRPSLRNFVLSTYLEFRMAEKVQKPSYSEYNTYIWLINLFDTKFGSLCYHRNY
jgi:hypothetical protein